MSVKAIDIAKWFIKKKYDYPRNTFDGNMKLQKLLYFAQLIHTSKNGELLFDDEMRAYRNGTVINNVRLPYRDMHTYLINKSKESLIFDHTTHETLQITEEIFGDMSPVELSELNHELDSWKLPYNASKIEHNEYDTGKSVINTDDKLFVDDVSKINEILESYTQENHTKISEEINGVTFYYDPNEMEITEDILMDLESCEFPDDTYTLTIDEQEEVIVL